MLLPCYGSAEHSASSALWLSIGRLVGLRPADVLKPSALTKLYEHVDPEQ